MRQYLSALAFAAALLPAISGDAQAQENAPTDAPALVQDYEPAPAMWRLSDEDTTIYMLGTVHLLPSGFRWRNAQLDGIVEEAEMLVLESSDADADLSMAQIQPKIVELLDQRVPTSQQLSPAVRPKWRRLVELSGQPFDYVDQMPVMIALMGFGMGELDMGPSSYEHGVETVLEQEFADNGRPVSSIEDTGRVMMSIYRINDNLVLPDLEHDLMTWDGREATTFFGETLELESVSNWEIEHNWARGEMDEVIDFGFQDAKLATAFRDVLLTSRNRRWAAWLDERLDSPGTILLAVGAGHFEGNDSLLVMLRERGLEAVRINEPAN